MLFNLGNVLNATGQVDEAIRELRRATELNPENADAHFNLAVIVGPRNRIDEAIVHLRKAIEINPRHAEAHRNLGVALGFQGRAGRSDSRSPDRPSSSAGFGRRRETSSPRC